MENRVPAEALASEYRESGGGRGAVGEAITGADA